jgi:hypothetical protein
VATLPFATERFAGFLRAGLKVLSVFRVRIFVTCIVEVCRPNVRDQRRRAVGAPLAGRNLWEPPAHLARGVTTRDDRCIA